MLSRLRASLALKLLFGGLVLALIVIGGVSAYLLVSRDSQTRQTALSNSNNRVAVMRQVLQRFTGTQAFSTAQGLAVQTSLVQALSGADPASQVRALFSGSTQVDIPDEVLLISDPTGRVLLARPSTSLGSVNLSLFEQTDVIGITLRGSSCAVATPNTDPTGACGVDNLAGIEPSYAVAVPVRGSGRAVVGVVAYVAPLQYQLERFSSLFQFPTAFIPASDPQQEIRQHSGADVAATTPPDIAAGVRAGSDLVDATYVAPDTAGVGTQEVAGSFAAVTAPDGKTLAGYVGVEVPLAPFIGDQRTDELTLGVITLFALLLTALVVIAFVERVVRRPIRRLERGVARIAGGDYTSPVVVDSRDELGRLATSVNQMRDNIGRYTSEIEEARARLDSNVERISGVSRALTTTTGGVAALEHEVVRIAAAIAGEGSAAVLVARDGEDLVSKAAFPEGVPLTHLERWESLPTVLSGSVVRDSRPGLGSLLAVPMFYQDAVVGALVLAAPAEVQGIPDDAEDVLVVLANNTAIAMENARLFEQERETVRRLRQLDAMKTDFLSTVQHELRTPLTAILGLSDLIEMCWDMWEDAPKLDAVRDIQVAARNLYDIVETIIDFSAVDGEAVSLSPMALPLAEAVTKGVELVGERYKGGLPIPVDIDVEPQLSIHADPDRFSQVIRAVVDNAVKFSDGKGRITVRAAAMPSRPDQVHIEVTDQGVGIPHEDIPRIFDRFYQVDNSATRRYGGTGMGLALVKRLVLAHGARVDVTSSVGKGTCVALLWPVTPAAAAAAVAATSAAASANGQSQAPATSPATPVS